MASIIEKINRKRLNLSHKLMQFLLIKRINNFYFLKLVSYLQRLLTKNIYFLNHKKSKHHFVPRFLLKNFKINNTGEIWEYKYNKRPKRISIRKKAALIENFYSFRDKKSQQQSDFIEDIIFAEGVEKYSPIVLDSILEKNIDLTGPEQSVMAMLVAFQYTRTPKFISQLKLLLTYLVTEKKLDINKLYKSRKYKEVFVDNFYNVNNGEFEKFTLKTDKVLSGKDLDQFLVSIALVIANSIQEAIFRMEFVILRVKEPVFLYLSDNPVILFNKNKQRFVGINIWEINNDDILIILPISPKVGVIFTKGDVTKEYISNIINPLSIANMDKSIYSDRDSVNITDSINRFHRTISGLGGSSL